MPIDTCVMDYGYDVNSKLTFAAYYHEDCECCANSYMMRTVHFVIAALSIFGPDQNAIV